MLQRSRPRRAQPKANKSSRPPLAGYNYLMAFTQEHCMRSRKDFPALTKNPQLAFLDGPGGSQVPQAVIDTLADFYATCNVNTHGKFAPSQEVDRRMDAARETLAAFLGAEH